MPSAIPLPALGALIPVGPLGAGLADLLAAHGDRVPLDRAAALLAKEESPSADVNAMLGRLDALATSVRMPPECEAYEATARLNHALFAVAGFRGDDEEYDDPRNSLLDHVLERKRGLPILLSVVYIEVARRLGIAVDPIGFPGHFLVSPRATATRFYVDPFHEGRILRADALREQLKEGDRAAQDAWLAPIGNKLVLTRMTVNLKGSYLRREDLDGALRQIDRLLLLEPERYEEHRDRGLLLARLDRRREAVEEFSVYLAARPGAPDARWIAQELAELKR